MGLGRRQRSGRRMAGWRPWFLWRGFLHSQVGLQTCWRCWRRQIQSTSGGEQYQYSALQSNSSLGSNCFDMKCIQFLVFLIQTHSTSKAILAHVLHYNLKKKTTTKKQKQTWHNISVNSIAISPIPLHHKAQLSPKCNRGFLCKCIWVKPSCRSIITTKEALWRFTVVSFLGKLIFNGVLWAL